MEPTGPAERVECLRCRSFWVTWNPNLPRGCRAFGFLSREMPSSVVLASSGEPCRLFEPKPAAVGGGRG